MNVTVAELIADAEADALSPSEERIAVEAVLSLPFGPQLSFDIFNRRAQGVLNRALKAVSKLTADARRDLTSALKPADPAESARLVVAFVQRYRQQLSALLGATNVAALLSGAREVADRLPAIPQTLPAVPPPPTLPPEEAVRLVDELKALPPQTRQDRVYALPPDQQAYVTQALSRGMAEPPAPPIDIPKPSGEEEGIHFPVIEEAARLLSEKNVLSRPAYDRLSDAARQKAFTVAGVESRETLEKIRDALSENVLEGVGHEAFREKALEAVGEGTFLSEPHLETIFRANVQAAFSDGQMGVLRHPFVRGGFPYAAYEAIHDDRVRHDHLALEKHGIGGGNVYRIDDPVFETFRPPWDYNDRCSWIPYTVQMAADAGVSEAKTWLASGVEPSPKAFVSMPPFSPPPGFRREVGNATLSVRLSMEPMNICLSDQKPPEAEDIDVLQVGMTDVSPDSASGAGETAGSFAHGKHKSRQTARRRGKDKRRRWKARRRRADG